MSVLEIDRFNSDIEINPEQLRDLLKDNVLLRNMPSVAKGRGYGFDDGDVKSGMDAGSTYIMDPQIPQGYIAGSTFGPSIVNISTAANFSYVANTIYGIAAAVVVVAGAVVEVVVACG